MYVSWWYDNTKIIIILWDQIDEVKEFYSFRY